MSDAGVASTGQRDPQREAARRTADTPGGLPVIASIGGGRRMSARLGALLGSGSHASLDIPAIGRVLRSLRAPTEMARLASPFEGGPASTRGVTMALPVSGAAVVGRAQGSWTVRNANAPAALASSSAVGRPSSGSTVTSPCTADTSLPSALRRLASGASPAGVAASSGNEHRLTGRAAEHGSASSARWAAHRVPDTAMGGSRALPIASASLTGALSAVRAIAGGMAGVVASRGGLALSTPTPGIAARSSLVRGIGATPSLGRAESGARPSGTGLGIGASGTRGPGRVMPLVDAAPAMSRSLALSRGSHGVAGAVPTALRALPSTHPDGSNGAQGRHGAPGAAPMSQDFAVGGVPAQGVAARSAVASPLLVGGMSSRDVARDPSASRFAASSGLAFGGALGEAFGGASIGSPARALGGAMSGVPFASRSVLGGGASGGIRRSAASSLPVSNGGSMAVGLAGDIARSAVDEVVVRRVQEVLTQRVPSGSFDRDDSDSFDIYSNGGQPIRPAAPSGEPTEAQREAHQEEFLKFASSDEFRELMMELLEDRLLGEIERRGGRYGGWFA